MKNSININFICILLLAFLSVTGIEAQTLGKPIDKKIIKRKQTPVKVIEQKQTPVKIIKRKQTPVKVIEQKQRTVKIAERKQPPVTIKKDPIPKVVNSVGLKNIGLVKYRPIRAVGTSSSVEREGPDINKYEDIGFLLDGNQYESFFEKLNIFRKIYKDKNSKANVFYYFPAEYTLKWNKENGEYAFNIYYMSSDEGKGSVLINAELTPRISNEDIKVAEKLLTTKLKKKVKLMPMDLRDVPKVDFGSTLTNFNVKPESIHASIPSDYHKPIVLDWRMDSNVDDFVGAMLNNIGVNINLEFRPYGDESTVINVPINFEVNTPFTFGKIEFNSTTELLAGWENNMDYPVVPHNLVLLRGQGHNRYFQNIPLVNEQIEKGNTFHLDSENKSELTKGNPILGLWIDYSLNKDCNECNQEVKKKIIGGTSGSQIANVEVQVLNALEYSEAHSMKLLIKSIQADPNGINEITFPALSITEDGQTIEGTKLYVPDGENLSYNYQVVMIMNDGDVKTSKWSQSSSSLLVLGESQLKKLFKELELSPLEKAKDSIIDKGKDDLLGKGLDLLGGLLSGKGKNQSETESNTDTEESGIDDTETGEAIETEETEDTYIEE